MAYNPELDRVVKDFGTHEIGGRSYRFEARKYGKYSPKLVVKNVYFHRGREMEEDVKRWPMEVVAFVAKHDILKECLLECEGTTPGRFLQGQS